MICCEEDNNDSIVKPIIRIAIAVVIVITGSLILVSILIRPLGYVKTTINDIIKLF